MAVLYRAAGARHVGEGRAEHTSPAVSHSCLSPHQLLWGCDGPSTPLLHSLHPLRSSRGILSSDHTSLWTLPQTQRHLPTSVPSIQLCLQPGTPCSHSCHSKSCSSVSAQLRSLTWARLSPCREKSNLLALRSGRARWHSALVISSLSANLPTFFAPQKSGVS